MWTSELQNCKRINLWGFTPQVICYGSAGTLVQPWAAVVGPAMSTPTAYTSKLAPVLPVHPHTGNPHPYLQPDLTPGSRHLAASSTPLLEAPYDQAHAHCVQNWPVGPSCPSPSVPVPGKGPTFTLRRKANFGSTLVHIPLGTACQINFQSVPRVGPVSRLCGPPWGPIISLINPCRGSSQPCPT